MNIKHLFAALALTVAATASAQDEPTQKYPQWFVGLQGGIQTTFTNYDNAKLITPTASVYGGLWFNRIVGARIHVNGAWDKGGIDGVKYNYNYITTDLDAMLNLVTLFGRKDFYPVNLYLIGGVGINTAFNNDDAYALQPTLLPWAWGDKRKICCNGRVGLQLDYRVTHNLGLNLEVAANSVSDRFNSKRNDNNDWQLTAQIGLAWRFGKCKKPAPEPTPEVWATRVDTTWYDETIYTPRTENGDAQWEVFYEIRESDFEGAEAKLKAIGNFLKDFRDCKISVKSYADRGTGNPKINMGYSQQRSEKAVKALTDAGVDPALITAEYFGDTVQPYAENDKNRVTIIRATGLKDVKDKGKQRKFRTEEVRYRVQ